jgi:pSer/pThr/pTyr-binding forkhead associated (FHA) protein
VRTDTNERFALDRDAVTIGRSSDCTISIDDTRVSRSHATLERTRTGWTVADAGSSNGTTVNGKALTPRTPQALKPGDVIGVGPVDLRVQPRRAQAAGTRALDDSDRTRISGEVLPPPRRPRP